MKILYITDEINSPINRNLCSAITKNNTFISITLLCINVSNKKVKAQLKSTNNLNEIILKSNYNFLYQRLNFFYKKNKKIKLIEDSISISDYDLVYASTSFSDGAVAYEIFKKYKIPYIVAVRATDINMYLHRMIHLRHIGGKIFTNAKSIICISSALKKNLIKTNLIKNLHIDNKVVIIPNGIDKFWIDNKRVLTKPNQSEKFLFIGHLIKNKNIETMTKAFFKAREINPNIQLTIVGEGDEYKNFITKISKEQNWIHYLGPIYDKNKLLKVIRQNDAFIMVSHSETFGLTYLESMSQGLPVIYTKNQGIDGMFQDSKVGESVDSHNIDNICEAIIAIANNYNNYDDIVNRIEDFSWNNNAYLFCKLLNDN